MSSSRCRPAKSSSLLSKATGSPLGWKNLSVLWSQSETRGARDAERLLPQGWRRRRVVASRILYTGIKMVVGRLGFVGPRESRRRAYEYLTNAWKPLPRYYTVSPFPSADKEVLAEKWPLLPRALRPSDVDTDPLPRHRRYFNFIARTAKRPPSNLRLTPTDRSEGCRFVAILTRNSSRPYLSRRSYLPL